MTSFYPLTREDISRVQLRFNSHFTRFTLADHAVELPELVWRNQQYEYVVGDAWKGRTDIGEVIELGGPSRAIARVLSHGPQRAAEPSWSDRRAELVEHLVETYRLRGASLVLVSEREMERSQSFYEARGWNPIEQIVYYQKPNTVINVNDHRLVILPATGRDIPRIMQLEKETFPWLWWYGQNEWASIMFSPGTETYLAYVDGLLVGYETHTVRTARGHLDRLGIHPAWQGERLGAELLAFGVRRMERLGAKSIGLSTQWNNIRSQRLYERHGFGQLSGAQTLHGRILQASAEDRLAQDKTKAPRLNGGMRY